MPEVELSLAEIVLARDDLPAGSSTPRWLIFDFVCEMEV
jgi:hypothetical protein